MRRLSWIPSCVRHGGDDGGSSETNSGPDMSFGGFKEAEREMGLATVDDVYGGNFQGDTGASIQQVDVGALAGGALGFLSGVPMGTKIGYELGKKMDWGYEFAYDPDAASQYAQDALSSYEGDRGDSEYKQLESNIREARLEAEKAAETEVEETDEERERRLRTERLSRGRGGLLYQGDESGVDNGLLSKKLGG